MTDGRAPGEVKYYAPGEGAAIMGPRLGKPVPWPYGGWCLESMDSHGGWIASAEDLVRFAAAFNHPKKCKVLNAQSIETMFARPPGAAGEDKNGKPADAYYACGWNVRPGDGKGKANTWHSGYIAGSEALLVRRWDGLDWAVLFNTADNPDGKSLSGLIDGKLHEAADRVKKWPGRDLFGKYLK